MEVGQVSAPARIWGTGHRTCRMRWNRPGPSRRRDSDLVGHRDRVRVDENVSFAEDDRTVDHAEPPPTEVGHGHAPCVEMALQGSDHATVRHDEDRAAPLAVRAAGRATATCARGATRHPRTPAGCGAPRATPGTAPRSRRGSTRSTRRPHAHATTSSTSTLDARRARRCRPSDEPAPGLTSRSAVVRAGPRRVRRRCAWSAPRSESGASA